MHVLNEMERACPAPRPTVPESVPRVRVLTVAPKKISEIIGTGGRTVRGIIDACGGEDLITIDIDSSGSVAILSTDEEMLNKAARMILAITIDVQVGQTFPEARVTKTLPFGAYVELDVASGKEGWLHISELEWHHVDKVTDVIKEGDVVQVKVVEVSARGQVRVSRKALIEKPSLPPPSHATADSDDVHAGDGSSNESNGSQARPFRRRQSPTIAPEASICREVTSYERDMMLYEQRQQQQQKRQRRPPPSTADAP